MENRNNRIIIILSILCVLSLLFGGLLVIKNKSAKLESAKDNSVFIAEKEMLNAEIKDLVREKKKILQTSYEQEKHLDEILIDIDKKNIEIQRLLADNVKVKDLRIKLKELEQDKTNLKNEVESLKGKVDQSDKINKGLENEILSLKSENDRLSAELMFVKSMHSNDFLINGIKRNQKITAFSKRTKTISLSFDFPADHVNDLNVNIITPNGKTLTKADTDFVSIFPSKDIASKYPSGTIAKRMELLVKPEKKFAKGIYKITLLSGGETIATMQLQLK